MKRTRLLALVLTLATVFSLMPVTALAAQTGNGGRILGKGAVDLSFDAEKAYVGDYTIVSASGAAVDFSCYRAAYCANPITGLEWAGRPSEDFFKLNVYVPKGYTDEQLKSAPILMINPWGGDNGSPVNLDPSTNRRKMPAMALERGWVVVEPGMRGNNCYTGELGGEDYCDYGKLPYPIADLKAAVRYLRYGSNAETIPGNKERIFFTGTSSGGDATVMIGSSGNSDFFAPYLEELGAADARDDVFCAAPSCPVMNREWGDPAIAWERWGDLSGNADALKLNAELCGAYIEYFNALGLKAEFDVPTAGIKKGDSLTDKNYADYLLVYEKRAAVKFLNSLGGKDAVNAYLASEKGTDMYGHPAVSRSMLKPVWSEDGKTVTDLDNTWEEVWYYNVGGEEHMSVKNVLNMQYDTPIDDEDLTAFEENGVLNTKIGARADGRANASNYTFGKSGDYACVLSSFGQDWLEKERGMTVSDEYRELIALQNHATDPLYFIVGEGAADEVTTAPNWYMRTGSVDLVVPTPNFFALAIALQNRGYTVDEALVWDQSHGETTDLDGFFRFASELLAKDKDDSLNFDANAAYKGTYTYRGVTFSTYQATYCANPVTGLIWGGQPSENYFKLNIKVPYGMTREELAKAPILIYNPWGGDRGSAVSAVDVLAFKSEPEIVIENAIRNGWVVVEPGMRGANCYTGEIGGDNYYNYGKLPYPIVDLKAAIRYLRFGDNAVNIPGNKEHMFIAGKSSGGDATVMIASTGNAKVFEPYLAEIGAAEARDDVYGAYAYCPVMMRSEGDNAIAWERWGDLSGDSGAAEVNAALTKDYIEFLNSLRLKAEFDVPSAGIKKGDALTAENYADYLLVYEKNAAVKFLNSLGGIDSIDEYLSSEKSTDMYGHPAISRSLLKPVYASDGSTVTDLDNSWKEIWYYNVGGEEHMNTANALNFQYDKPFYYAEVQKNAVLKADQSEYNNASTQSFGKATDYAAVFSEFGQEWVNKKYGISINSEYQKLYELQRNSVDPMYWVAGDGEGTSDVAGVWFMRTGTVDLVVPTPNFVALATALENRGKSVDAELVWDDGHVIGKNTWNEFFAYADKAMGRAAAFADVRDGDWYGEYVSYVAANGLMNGVSDDRFDPTGAVSRAMAVTVLYRMAGSPAVTGETKFTDLTADWYKAAVKWAVDSGVTTGTGDATFAPNAAITREQLAVMLFRYAQLMKRDTSSRAELSAFADAGSVSAYARDAMAWANGTGLITGESASTLNPTGGSSRAVLAAVLTRFAKSA